MITWPRPNPGELALQYASRDYYDSRQMGEEASSAWHGRAAGILARLPRPIRSALDFGAGEGHLVRALSQLGLTVVGFEPSPAGRAAARSLYGLDLLDDLSAAAAQAYDLVTLVHALEHVPDPMACMARVFALLAPGGLAYIEVPHAGSIEMWLPRHRARILDLPVHLHHFVPATLVALVTRAGLTIQTVEVANPFFVEALLGLRRPVAAATPATGPDRPTNEPSTSLSGAARSYWRTRLLPGIRKVLPGGHIRLVALRPK